MQSEYLSAALVTTAVQVFLSASCGIADAHRLKVFIYIYISPQKCVLHSFNIIYFPLMRLKEERCTCVEQKRAK